MIAMNNLLIDLLHCQQKTHNGTTCTLQFILQTKRDHTNESMIDNIPT